MERSRDRSVRIRDSPRRNPIGFFLSSLLERASYRAASNRMEYYYADSFSPTFLAFSVSSKFDVIVRHLPPPVSVALSLVTAIYVGAAIRKFDSQFHGCLRSYVNQPRPRVSKRTKRESRVAAVSFVTITAVSRIFTHGFIAPLLPFPYYQRLSCNAPEARRQFPTIFHGL